MTSSRSPGSVVIVGAGIVGVSAGFFLARAGCPVVILDAFGPAAGPTGASDGAVSVASKKPGPMMRLATAGVGVYEALTASGALGDEFRLRPTFIVAEPGPEREMLDRHGDALRAAGVTVTRLEGPALRDRLPALGHRAAAALEVHGEGHAIGYRVVHRLAAAAGLAIVRGERVTGLHRDGRQTITGVETTGGTRKADTVIVAAGGGSAALAGLGDILRPRKGQLIVTERRDARFPPLPGSLMSSRYLASKGVQPAAGTVAGRSFGLVVDPLETGQLLIGGTREESGDPGGTDLDAVRRLLAEAVELCPPVSRLRVLRVFAGVRTATRDGLPIVGRLPDAGNGWIATGFEGDGICLGPLIGRTLAELVCGREPAIDVAMLDPHRFAETAGALQ